MESVAECIKGEKGFDDIPLARAFQPELSIPIVLVRDLFSPSRGLEGLVECLVLVEIAVDSINVSVRHRYLKTWERFQLTIASTSLSLLSILKNASLNILL